MKKGATCLSTQTKVKRKEKLEKYIYICMYRKRTHARNKKRNDSPVERISQFEGKVFGSILL